jgi:hypothetical protein
MRDKRAANERKRTAEPGAIVPVRVQCSPFLCGVCSLLSVLPDTASRVAFLDQFACHDVRCFIQPVRRL